MLNIGKRFFSHPVKWGWGGGDVISTKPYSIFQPVLGDQGEHGSYFFFYKRQWALLVKAVTENGSSFT